MDRRLRALTLGALLMLTFLGSTGATPAPPRPTPSAPPNVAVRVLPDAASLYSPHARRLVAAYLRLRMLELRELDLDRVRAVIEGKLRVDDLLAPPSRPPAVVR